MKTSLAAAALAVLLPLQAGAAPVKGDPLKWDPATERNAPSEWLSTQIGDDTYIAYLPPAPLWKTTYAPKAAGAKLSTPLFKVGKAAQAPEDPKKKGSQVWTVATEPSNYRLDLGAKGKLYDIVCVQTAADCPPKFSMPLPLSEDGGAIKGIPTSQSNVVLRVTPPSGTTAATPGADDKTAKASDGAPLGVWEKIAFESIAKPTDEQARDIAKDAAPNTKSREALNAGLATYLTAAQAKKPTDALSPSEVGYIKARLGADGAAFEASAKWPDASSADAQKFTTRWRGLIVKEVNDYNSKGADLRASYAGSTAELTAVRKDDLNAAQAPGSPLEAKLAAFHPGTGTRREGAQRAVVAAWIENQQKDAKFKKIKDDLMAGKTPGMSWDAMLAAAVKYIPDQVKDPKSPALAGLSKDTLLDAYCDPNKTTGAAAGPRSASDGAMNDARSAQADATTAANGVSLDQTGTGGAKLDGGATAAVDPLQNECSNRLAKVRSLVPDAPVGTVGNLTAGTIVPAPAGGTGGATGDKFNGSNIGKNEKDDPAAGKDAKMGDHVRVGAAVGLFLGLMGMVGGGPIGLLVLGAVGFGIGFGIDKMTNKGT